MLRLRTCCRCFCFDVFLQWCASAKMKDLLPLLCLEVSRSGGPMLRFVAVAWCRSDAPVIRCTICCNCFNLREGSKWCPNAKMYDVFAVALVFKWSPNAKMYDCCRCFGLEAVPWCYKYYLLPLLWSRSGAPKLRCTIKCRWFGLEIMPQCWDVGFFRWFGLEVVPYSKMYDLLPLLWSRTVT